MASATEQSIVRKLNSLTNSDNDVADAAKAGRKAKASSVSSSHKTSKKSSASSSSSSSSSSSKKMSTRTVESAASQQLQQQQSSSSRQNHHSFNQRLRNMLEIFRCRLNSSSSAAAARRRSSALPAGKPQAHRPSNAQPPVTTSTAAPVTPVSTSTGAAKKSGDSPTCCQLCINECAETDPADGSAYMFSIATCEHAFCVNCLRLYLKYQIVESRVSISCPQCSEKMHPNDIYTLLSTPVRYLTSPSAVESDVVVAAEVKPPTSTTTILARSKEEAAEQQRQWAQLIDKYEEFMLRRVLVAIPDVRFCPAPDCPYAVIASGCANCPQLNCQRAGCSTSFCYHCKQRWHPNLTCEDAAFQSAAASASASAATTYPKFNSSSNIIRSFLQRSDSHLSITSLSGATTTGGAKTIVALDGVIKDEIKRCPKCQALIVKMDDGSCNHITCAVCGCEFCWLCMKEISDLHYLSPSGCTFWGKKPWSRKKKILWQLGTLVGAPVGIALVAGVAVPAIIIGLPIWAGRKVYVRYKSIGKHKRNLIVCGTVVGTVIVAPFVAALAVGIGVPILLAYVYGVVPISLCRSGGCGVTTNTNGGVRFAFDDETDNGGGGLTLFGQNSSASGTGVAATATASKPANKARASSNTATTAAQVTTPISAIDLTSRPVPAADSTVSSASDSATATTALIPAATKKSVSINTGAAPVLVTITMANKSAHRGGKQKQRRTKPHSPGKKVSSRKTLKNHRFATCPPDAAAQVATATASATIASVACGSVESNQATLTLTSAQQHAQVQTATGASTDKIAGNVMTHLTNKLTSSLNIPAAPANDVMSSSSVSAASSSHLLLLDQHSTEKPSDKKPTTTTTARLNNPSIGETSIGAYSASENCLDLRKRAENDQDDEDDADTFDDESESDSDDSDDESESEESDSDDDDSDDDEDGQASGQINDADRDSASNRALAGGSLCKETYAALETSSVTVSLKNDTAKTDTAAAVATDTKSVITTSSYATGNFQPVVDSVSMRSDTRSVNPSVTALAGSIKDNQSVENLSNN